MATATEKNFRYNSRALQHFSLLALLYTLLIFILPPSARTMAIYNLSGFEYRIVLFALALPMIAVWLAAFFGYAKLREYAFALGKSPEGTYFNQLALGCTWLAWSLPIGTILPTLLNAIANDHPAFDSAAIIITNYISLILPLIAFSIIAGASRGLLVNAKAKLSLVNARAIILAFLALGVLYCFMTFRRFDLSSLGSTLNPYFLPLWLMVLTVTIPYLYAWFIGMLAAYEIVIYSRHVQGVLYRQALWLLVTGLLAVIISSIALQYVLTVEPDTGSLAFNLGLVLLLLFKVLGGAGFVLLALGAIRLRKIEEV